MITDTVWELRCTNLIKFGCDAVKEVGYEAKRLSSSKVLVITDEGVKEAGICKKVEDALSDSGLKVSVWDKVEPEPSIESYSKCYEDNKDQGFDLVVSVGGGSSLDIGKTISMMLKHGGEVTDYIRPPIGKGKGFPKPGVPNIAIPTTSGTGSEVTQVSVLSSPNGKAKVAISDPFLRPNVAIVDPRLTVTLPSHITGSTGLDALTHAIEAYTSKSFDQMAKPDNPGERSTYASNPITDILAIKAIKLISKYLRRAVNNGYDLEARKGMSLASCLSGIAFGNAGVNVVHALGHTIGAQFHCPHGVSCAVLLPAVMHSILSVDHEHLTDIAEAMGEKITNLNQRNSAMRAVNAVENLIKDVNIPLSLTELGCTEEDIPRIVDDTLKNNKSLVRLNRRQFSKEDLDDILRNAL